MVTFAVNLQTPLYSVYAKESNIGSTGVTIAFAAYVAGLLPTLFFLGGLSDRIGRRLPIIMSLLLCVSATALLVVLPSWGSLFIARLLLGIGTGLVTTSGAAYMSELLDKNDERFATLLVASSTSLGFSGGALATSFSLSLHGPSLMPASFIILFISVPILAIAFFKMPRVDTLKNVPLFRLPIFPPNTWLYGLSMTLAWATTGMIIAIVPLELKNLQLDNWTGLVIFLAIFVGFLCQPIARKMNNANALVLGAILIPIGFIIIVLGVWLQSLSLILLGSAITSSASYGFTYLSALSEFGSRAPNNKARATAGLFIYAYLGFSVPVVASGALADMLGLLPAMIVFSITIIIATIIILSFCYRRKQYILEF